MGVWLDQWVCRSPWGLAVGCDGNGHTREILFSREPPVNTGHAQSPGPLCPLTQEPQSKAVSPCATKRADPSQDCCGEWPMRR